MTTLTVAAARSSSGGVGVAIRYMLPVLWMTSCLHTLGVSTVDTFAASDESGRVHRARGAGGGACNAALPCLLVHGPLTEDHFWICSCVKAKGSPCSITERRVSELIPVLGSQPAGDVSHKPGSRLPLLSARPAVTLATLKRATTSFAAW